MIFLHAFSGIRDFLIAFFVYTDGQENCDILDFSTLAAFKADTIYIDVRVLFRKRAGTPFFHMLLCLLVEVTEGSWGHLTPPERFRDVLITANGDTGLVHLN